jgi:hypothetical protein
VDRGQRRNQERRFGDVVESDDADVGRHAHAALVEGVHDAQRHLVVRGEYRGDIRVSGKFEPGAVARVGAPVAAQHGRGGDTGAGETRLPTLEPLAGLEPVGGAGHVPHGAMPE